MFENKDALLLDMNSTFMFREDRFGEAERRLREELAAFKLKQLQAKKNTSLFLYLVIKKKFRGEIYAS